MTTLLVLLPDFAIIALGFMLGKRIPDPVWQHIDSLCYFVFYPALLFSAASQRSIALPELILIGALAFAVVSAGFVLSLLVGRWSYSPTAQTWGGIAQNAWRFNTALGFVAVIALAPEAVGYLAIIVGLAIPLANFYAVWVLAKGQVDSLLVLFREIMLNPFLLASLAGVAAGISGAVLPELVTRFVDRLAGAAIPVVLLSLGAALSRASLWPPDRHTVAINVIKLVCLPSLVWLVIVLFDLHSVLAATLLVFSALPTASAAHVLAARYGADRHRVAVVVMQSTLAGLITLPFWSAVAAGLIK